MIAQQAAFEYILIMVETGLDDIKAHVRAGDFETAHSHAIALAEKHQHDSRAQLAAAIACDRLGLEAEAAPFYEIARQLGVPQEDRKLLVVGYASTLRNLGRAEESIHLLTEALEDDPDDTALQAFLALALHSAGHKDSALAIMLKAALQGARENAFAPFARALNEY